MDGRRFHRTLIWNIIHIVRQSSSTLIAATYLQKPGSRSIADSCHEEKMRWQGRRVTWFYCMFLPDSYGYDMGLRFVEIIEKREHAFKTQKFKTGIIDGSYPKTPK